MNNTLLVTGGAGFIGSCYIRSCLKNGIAPIVNLDKLTYAASRESLDECNHDPNYALVEGDIIDEPLIANLLTKYSPFAIVHFAAETHVDRSIDSPHAFVQTNVGGTVALLQASRKYWQTLPPDQRDRFRFLYVSTDEVYGSGEPSQQFAEASPIAPSSPYAASKAAAGHFCQSFHVTYGLPTLETRSSNCLGPFQFPEKLIPLVTLNAVEGRPLPVYGDGRQTRDWLFVDDNCEAISKVLESGRPGEVYNISSGQARANIDVVRSICNIVDQEMPTLSHRPCESLIEFVADRPGHDANYMIDSTKIRNELGWAPSHDFADALRRTVNWYLHNPDWVERVSQRYQRTRLGLGGPSASCTDD